MKYIALILAIVAFIFLVWLTWIFIGYFQASSDNIKASLIGVGSIVGVALITQHFSKKRESAARHFVEKTNAYNHIFDLIFEQLKVSKNGGEISEDEIAGRGIEIKKALLIWGNINVLQAWNTLEKDAGKVSARKIVGNVEKLFAQIRKDLGHDDGHLKEGELIKIIIAGDDKENFLENDQSTKS